MSSTEWETNEQGFRIRECHTCGGPVFRAETLAGQRKFMDPQATLEGTFGIDVRDVIGDRLIALPFSGNNLDALRIRGDKPLFKEHVCGR